MIRAGKTEFSDDVASAAGDAVCLALNLQRDSARLSVKDLITMRLPAAVLAFLSACQTARGSEHLSDQAVHLAASMLFCGLRSVIGTMW
jgi:CHAT domain-containing protein